MPDEVLFTLRPATDDDLPFINSYAYNEGMDDIPGIDGVTVAAGPDGGCIGFIRMMDGDGEFAGVGFINPVVVVGPWRGYGVGKALVDDAQTRYAELRLVSRSASHEFYRALGFEDATWEMIRADIASDCDGCPVRGELCEPQPMRRLTAEAHPAR